MPTPPYFLYLKPKDIVNFYNDSVPSVSGAVEDEYDANWLVDGQPGRPTRTPGGGASFSVGIPGGRDVNFVGLVNHNIFPGIAISVGGAVTGEIISTGELKNPYKYFVPGALNAESVTISLGGSDRDVIIGEAVIGWAREIVRPMQPGGRRRFPHANEPRGGLYNSLTSYDYKIRPRTVDFQTTATDAGMTEIEKWYDETRDLTEFSAIVPDPSKNEFWHVIFQGFEYSRRGPDWYEVTFTFEEKRVGWQA